MVRFLKAPAVGGHAKAKKEVSSLNGASLKDWPDKS